MSTIALVIFRADPTRGGAERYTFDLARSLAKRGHKVSLLSSSFGQRPDGVDCIALPASAATRLGAYRRFLDSLDQHLLQNPYDIVHAMLPVRQCDFYHPHAGLAAEAVANGHLKHSAGVKQAAAQFLNRFNRKRKAFADVERDLLTGPNAPITICLSEYIRRSVREYYSLENDRLAVVFNGIDIERFDPARMPEARNETRERLRLSDEKVVALIIAQDFERKGLHQAIEALARVEQMQLVLVVVGKEQPSNYRAQAESLGVADRVLFVGSTSTPHDFYQAADFFVLPTRHDPCSLVVLEALATGLPVISTRQNGATEIMTEGDHGYILADAADVAGLADAMRRLLDATLRQRMREKCLQLRPALSDVSHVDKLVQLYQLKEKR